MEAEPHVFISYKHPLAEKESVNLEDLSPYPYLSFFEQGNIILYSFMKKCWEVWKEKSL